MALRAKTARTGRRSTRRNLKAKTSRGKTARLAPATKAAVQSMIAKTMARKAETKFVSSYAGDTAPNAYTTVNSVISGTGQWSSAIPLLSQAGSGSPPLPASDYTRLGNEITPQQLKAAIDVRLVGTVDPVDLTVVVYYGICKKYRTFTDVNSNSAALCSELLRLGGVNGSGAETQSFNGIASDSHLLVNTDVFKLKKKTFKLYKCAGIVNGVGTGVFSAQNKVQHSFMLDWASFLPETIKYDQNADTLPIGFVPIWTMGYYYNDQTAPVTGTGGAIEYKLNRFLTFKDM